MSFVLMKIIVRSLSFIVLLALTGHAQGPVPGSIPQRPTPTPRPYSDSVVYLPRQVTAHSKMPKPRDRKVEASAPEQMTQAAVLAISVLDQQGKVIPGLKSADFGIFVDEKEVPIQEITVKNEPLVIILVIASSFPIFPEADRFSTAAMAVIAQLRPQDRMIVAKFDELSQTITEASGNREDLENAVRKPRSAKKVTALYDSLEKLFTNTVASVNGRKAVVLITDGVDTASKRSTFESSLAAAEKSHVTVIPVFVDTFSSAWARSGPDPGRWASISPAIAASVLSDKTVREEMNARYAQARLYLNDIVFLSGGLVVPYEAIVASGPLSGIREAIATQYLISVDRKHLPVSGDRATIRVRVNRPEVAVLAPGSYLAP